MKGPIDNAWIDVALLDFGKLLGKKAQALGTGQGKVLKEMHRSLF